MADEAMSPLHQLMIDDITIRKITPKTKRGYIHPRRQEFE